MMKKFIYLTAASLVIAASVSSAGQAQTSVPTNSDVAPNNLPATPAPGGNTGPNSVTPVTPGSKTIPSSTMPATPSDSTMPATPSNSAMPGTTTPSASTMGTCGMNISSTGMTSSGTGMTSSGTGMTSSGGGTLSSGTGMNSSGSRSETYKTSTDSSVIPLMKLNTNPALSTTASSTTTSTTSVTDIAPHLLDASSDQVEYNNLIGPAHYIKLAVGSSSPLCYLSVAPLQDVYAVDSIRVLDQSGKGVPATVTKLDNGSAKISFDQPIAAGSNLVLALQGVEYSSTLTPTTVQYYVSGGFANYSQEIPYGVAQIQRFLR
jgi:hypothetical protein